MLSYEKNEATGQNIASSAGISSCHFQSYTISSSSNLSDWRSWASSEQSNVQDGAWGEKTKREMPAKNRQ